MDKKKEQVSIFKLVFTHNWEDPVSDHAALKIKPNDAIMAITSGGCNVLGFLMFDPKVIYSLDINPTQSYLLELKIAAMKTFDFNDFKTFAGLTPSTGRAEMYEKLLPLLSQEAIDYFNNQSKLIKEGFIMNGQYEGFIKIAGKLIMLLQGRKRVLGLFEDKSQKDQEAYFDKIWDTRRFHSIFKILFNKHILARRGLVADYFHFDDGSTSFSESFYKRAKNAFRNIPIKGNYFLSLYLLGKFQNDEEVPAYLKEENYQLIKSRLNRIKIYNQDAQGWIDSMPDESIDCFALSNICELMSEKETAWLFSGVLKTARKNARVIFRNLMIPREVPDELKNDIVKDTLLSKQIYASDRSFVYGKVAAYSIRK